MKLVPPTLRGQQQESRRARRRRAAVAVLQGVLAKAQEGAGVAVALDGSGVEAPVDPVSWPEPRKTWQKLGQ